MWVHWCARVLGTGSWGLENNPRVRTAVECGDLAWRKGRRKSATGDNLPLDTNWAVMETEHYCWVTWNRWSHLCSLCLPTPKHWLLHSREGASRAVLLLWPMASLQNWHHQGHHNPSSHATSIPYPRWSKPKSFRAASRAAPVNDSNANIEMKPQLSSRGKVTNEAYKKPSMECKRTISVPTKETALALADIEIGEKHRQE